MKKSKLIKIIALTIALTSVGTIGANAATSQSYWQSSNNGWYYYSNGSMQTGWINDGGNWYYCNSNGIMQTGWIYDGGNWYYCYSNGQMATNTTIDGCYLNEKGSWSLSKPITTSSTQSSQSELTADDINKHHSIRGDIGSRETEIATGKQLSSSNISVDYDSEMLLVGLSDNLAAGRITIDEARSSCIGKSLNNKYKITNITFLKEVFPNSKGTFTEREVSTIKASSLYSYVPSSSYAYDKYLVVVYGNAKSGEWEAMRLVLEFEAL